MKGLDSFRGYLYFFGQKENDTNHSTRWVYELQHRNFSNLLLFPLRFNLLFLRGFFYPCVLIM
jgi:hypothetical protein